MSYRVIKWMHVHYEPLYISVFKKILKITNLVKQVCISLGPKKVCILSKSRSVLGLSFCCMDTWVPCIFSFFSCKATQESASQLVYIVPVSFLRIQETLQFLFSVKSSRRTKNKNNVYSQFDTHVYPNVYPHVVRLCKLQS